MRVKYHAPAAAFTFRATMPTEPITYKDAGVDIEAGDELVERIKPAVKRSLRPEVLGSLGGFISYVLEAV